MQATSASARVGRRVPVGGEGRERRQLRASARGLVHTALSSEEDATIGEIAELALLRALWLQRATRTAARLRQVDAAVLLARSSVECCIVGLYCVHDPTALGKVSGDSVKRFKALLRPLMTGAPLSPELLERSAAELGTEGSLPTVRQLVETIVEHDEHSIAGDMYERVYVPTSSLFAHSSGLALMRHTNPKSHNTRVRPWRAWSSRAAVHTADACVGALAAAVAGPGHEDHERFDGYARRHWRRVVTPLGFVTMQVLKWRLRPSAVPAAFAEMRRLRAYFRSDAVRNDSTAESEARLRAGLVVVMRALGTEAPQDLLDWWSRKIVGQLMTDDGASVS